MKKRIFDLIIVLSLLPVLLPILILIYILVRVNLGKPVFYSSQRPGLDCKPFKMFKFRTMTNTQDEFGSLLPDKERTTNFGNFLRMSSLDELPETWNVIKGEMSLVGPRPLLMEYIELYDKKQIKRHSVLPGITGLAQINGRNSISWEKKFKYDLLYVKNQSLTLDIKILFLTIYKVIKKDGIYSNDEAIVTKFTGNKNKN